MLVVDGQYGLHPSDQEVLTWLRHNHPSKPVVLAVNKCESTTKGATQVNIYRVEDAGLGCRVYMGMFGFYEEVLTWLRHNHPSKPVVLAVNKCESTTKRATHVGISISVTPTSHHLQLCTASVPCVLLFLRVTVADQRLNTSGDSSIVLSGH